MTDGCAAASPICEPGGRGMFLPLTESEADLAPGLRAAIYGSLMVFFFVGIAIIADTFVASIEVITARWKKVRGSDGQVRTSKVWNDTVATLTLMALGSSAPEIFLAVIDVPKKGFHAAELGPSTIVGSASFNLLMIIAVCIMAIPSDEVRVIKELPAFYITAFFSLFAYVWLAFILTVTSKDAVEPWEAVLTLLFLPMLVWVSYKSDVGAFDCLMERLGLINIVDGASEDEIKHSPSKTLHGRSRTEFQKEEHEVRQSSKEDAAHGRNPVRRPSEIEREVEAVKKKYAWLGFGAGSSLDVQLTGEDQEVKISVLLSGASTEGEVTCKYTACSFTAKPGVEYEELEGELTFGEERDEAGCAEQTITLSLPAWTGNKARSQLLIVLEDADGAEFDPYADGGSDRGILTVTLLGERAPTGCKSLVSSLVDLDGIAMGLNDWAEQATSAFYAGGSKEEQVEAGAMDWFSHITSLPWKVFFILVPPPSFFGGWLCFFSSLGMIALLTGFVSDLAELFGCVLELGDVVTAITFVALGTSMPDLFASLSSAREDETADASIVNVTGSNSVNVFLGLGLPWSICAIYWSVQDRMAEWTACYPEMANIVDQGKMVFVVESGSIGFSVGAFSCVCLMALALITLRRRWLGAELGGPFVPKVVSSVQLVLFWAAWISIVAWWVLRPDADGTEQAAVFSTVVVILTLTFAGTITCIFNHRTSARPADDVGGDEKTAPPAVEDSSGDEKVTCPAEGLVRTPSKSSKNSASPRRRKDKVAVAPQEVEQEHEPEPRANQIRDFCAEMKV